MLAELSWTDDGPARVDAGGGMFAERGGQWEGGGQAEIWKHTLWNAQSAEDAAVVPINR